MIQALPPPTRSEIAAVLLAAVAGGVVSALQPLLLGGLAAEASIGVTQIGQAATLEACGMGIAAGLAGAWLRPRRLRIVAAGAGLVAVTANVVTAFATGWLVLASRGTAGLASGLLLWLVVGLFARASNPARLFGIYVTALSVTSLLLATAFAGWVIPRYGSSGGYAVLAGFDLVVIAAAALLPSAYVPLPRAENASRWPPSIGVAALSAVFLHLAGVMALWVYIVPLVVQSGSTAVRAGAVVSIAIAAQIVGGVAASALAGRVRPVAVLLGTLSASLIAVGVLATSHAAIAVFAAATIFGFCWMFAPPFQMPFLIAVDPSRRTAMMISSAQLFGSGVGPVMASLAVIGTDVAWIAMVAAGLLASAGVVLLIVVRIARRSAHLPAADASAFASAL